MSTKDFGMYTDQGNIGIEALVNYARTANLTWAETYEAMRKLADSNEDLYGEAMDTAVREIVYDTLGFSEKGENFYI